MGGDLFQIVLDDIWVSISIHAPRVGGDALSALRAELEQAFQSTPPVWGATIPLLRDKAIVLFQSTPPVWGATLSLEGR